MRVNASMGCQRFELISYDLIFNVMSRSLLTGSRLKICDLLGSICPVTVLGNLIIEQENLQTQVGHYFKAQLTLEGQECCLITLMNQAQH